MKLSIVIPAYNEAKRIGETLQKIRVFCESRNIDTEIVIVDDGSCDETVSVTQKGLAGFRGRVRILENERNRGKGYSVRRGMLEASGDYILFSDADLSTPIEECISLTEAITGGCDVAIGSRDLPNSRVEIRQNLIRELMGKVFNRIARCVAFRGIQDSQCGFKCFKHDVAKKLFSMQKLDGFSFDAEIIYLAQKLGFEIREIPVTWRNSTASKVRIGIDPLKMFLDLLRIRFIHFHDSQSRN